MTSNSHMTDEKTSTDDVMFKTETSGFYAGFNKTVALGSKIFILMLVLWAVIFSQQAGGALLTMREWTLSFFNVWYIWGTSAFMIICLLIALWPKSRHIRLGGPNEKPEFSRFSWLSMMFSAGVGVGMLTYSTAEPIFHFVTNPDVMKGVVEGGTAENVRYAFKWSFFHYGMTPWAIYGIVGMSLGFFAYNRNMPLSFRSALMPLFGNAMKGWLGDLVEVIAIFATIIGVSVTIGYGVSQFASGVFNITGFDWITVEAGKPTLIAQLLSLVLIISFSIVSASTGVNKGIKWLSNINMSLSIFLLVFFVIFGATLFAFKQFFITLWDYIVALPAMSFTAWSDGELAKWQGAYTIFYWAWWIGFAPFVGLFLARVSRGRSLREYVIGAIIIPAVVGLTWFVLVGGTAVHLELTGIAQGAIINADISAQLYETINLILSPLLAKMMSLVIVVLLLKYLVTSADSAILVVTTIASNGNRNKAHTKHIVIWGLIYIAVVASLLMVGGLDALTSAMIIAALPFSFVMLLLTISLVKTLAGYKQNATPTKIEDKG